jgi:hypothetical protein
LFYDDIIDISFVLSIGYTRFHTLRRYLGYKVLLYNV